MSATASEKLFEKACEGLALSIRRIREASRPRPDYKVTLDVGALVVEVKQVGSNADDKEREWQLSTTGRSFGGVSLTRLRPLVAAANKQLRPWALRGIPTVVALYDPHPFQLYTEDHHVRSLFGDIGISMPVHGHDHAAQDVVFARNQILSDRKNRSVSAVIAIREQFRAPIGLVLFHNPYSRIPLQHGCAERLGMREVRYTFVPEE